MSNLRQAAQQALEALVQWEDEAPHAWSQADEDAVAALRAALAEPEQEPVAYFDPQEKGFYWAKPTVIKTPTTVSIEPLPLYSAPTPRKPLTEEEIVKLMVGEDRVQLLFTKPGDPGYSEFAEGAIRELVESGRAIERAHGIGDSNE